MDPTPNETMAHPAWILNLSTEVLWQIFGYFCLHCCGGFREPYYPVPELELKEQPPRSTYAQHRQALFTVCLVSRRFRDIGQEIMYHEFLLGLTDPPPPLHPYFHSPRLVPLIRTVSSRPDLARLLKTVFIEPGMMRHLDLNSARSVYQQAVESLGTTPSEIWRRRESTDFMVRQRTIDALMEQEFFKEFFTGSSNLQEGGRDTSEYLPKVASELFALLVALLPNLEHLLIRAGFWPGDFPPGAMSALGVTSLPLKILYFDRPPRSLMEIAPSLENMIYGGRSPLPVLPKMKTVRLRAPMLDTSDLSTLLSSFTGGIDTFEFTTLWANMWCVDEGTRMMVPPRTLVRLLGRFKSTLESLQLDFRYRVHKDLDKRLEPIQTLKDFTALEDLFITTNSVYNTKSLELPDDQSLVNLLPPSVVTLILADHEFPPPPERLQRGLLGLAAHMKRNERHFSKLKVIKCDTKAMFADSHVMDKLSELGIDLKYEEFTRRDWSYKREPLGPDVLWDEHAVVSYQVLPLLVNESDETLQHG
ncbi:hypothetical protein ACJ41O_013680 [Fusarium nematophilum]